MRGLNDTDGKDVYLLLNLNSTNSVNVSRHVIMLYKCFGQQDFGGDYRFATTGTVPSNGNGQGVVAPGTYQAGACSTYSGFLTGTAPAVVDGPFDANFVGANACGIWSLYVSDIQAGGSGSFSGWTLEGCSSLLG